LTNERDDGGGVLALVIIVAVALALFCNLMLPVERSRCAKAAEHRGTPFSWLTGGPLSFDCHVSTDDGRTWTSIRGWDR
jgi:hypothetical protein